MNHRIKKSLLSALILLFSLCLFVACDNNNSSSRRYMITFDVDGNIYHTITTSGEEVIMLPSEPNKLGYRFDGWYFDDGEWTKPFTEDTYRLDSLSHDTFVYAKWTLTDYNVLVGGFENNDGSASGQGKYDYQEEVTVSFALRECNVFVGWFMHDSFLSSEDSYSFTMPANDVELTAKCCKVAVEKNLQGAGTVTTLKNKYSEGDSETLTATTNIGYTWLGWFDGDDQVGVDMSYTFTIPDENKTITAKWQVNDEMSNYVFKSTPQYCIITDVIDKTLTQMSIADYVNEIGYEAFAHCYNLESIVVPDTVTTINKGAFKSCTSLRSISLPFIGQSMNTTVNANLGFIFGAINPFNHADYVPSSLSDVIISGGRIDGRAFYDCRNIINVTLPKSLMSIGSDAFHLCTNLKSITIPDTVTSIGSYAFLYCDNLTNINYAGTQSQWSNISKGIKWNYNDSNCIITCTDGTLDKQGNLI